MTDALREKISRGRRGKPIKFKSGRLRGVKITIGLLRRSNPGLTTPEIESRAVESLVGCGTPLRVAKGLVRQVTTARKGGRPPHADGALIHAARLEGVKWETIRSRFKFKNADAARKAYSRWVDSGGHLR